MTNQAHKTLGSQIVEDVMKALRDYIKSDGGDSENDYSALVELAELIGNAPQKPENANQMIDGNGEVIHYDQDPSKISQK